MHCSAEAAQKAERLERMIEKRQPPALLHRREGGPISQELVRFLVEFPKDAASLIFAPLMGKVGVASTLICA
jgi:hypothetical protein